MQPSAPVPSSSVARRAGGLLVIAAGTIAVALGISSLALSPRATPGPPSFAAAAPASSGTAASAGPSPSSTPPAATPGDPVIVGAGDIATCEGDADEATAALVDQAPGIVFTLGDNAYPDGSADDFRRCYGPGWGRFRDRTLLPVPGNHDHLTEGAAGYRAYFGAAAAPDGTTWYSTDVGTWHVVVLDANCEQIEGGCGPESPQVQWLREDLADAGARCTLALWHQPRFSSGFHGGDTAVAPFWDELYAAGADLVLNGHDHDYERFAPQDPTGALDRATGITQLVVGTGGAALRELGEPVPNTVVRQAIAHGVLVLTLRPSGWAFRFVSIDGSFEDSGTGSCH